MAITDWAAALKIRLDAVLDAAVAAAIVQSGAGVVYNYDAWPATLMAKPSILIGVIGGDQTYGISSPKIAHHNLNVWMYFPTFTLAQAMKMAVPFIKLLRDDIAGHMTLGGLVDHILPPDPPAQFYEGPGELMYAGNPNIGIIFHFDVKEHSDAVRDPFTVAA